MNEIALVTERTMILGEHGDVRIERGRGMVSRASMIGQLFADDRVIRVEIVHSDGDTTVYTREEHHDG